MTGSHNAPLRLREDGLDWRLVEDEIVVLDSNESVYLALNGTAALLWQALADGATRAELRERLEGQFDVAPDAAEHDVEQFLGQLREHGLLDG